MHSSRRIHVRRVVGILFAVPAAITLASTPAQAAGHTTVVYSNDGGSTFGAKSIFYGNQDPERFQTCDTKSDGYRSWSKLTWPGGSVTIEDSDGSSAFCDDKPGNIVSKNVPEGATVEITTCLKDGANDTPFDCGFGYGDA